MRYSILIVNSVLKFLAVSLAGATILVGCGGLIVESNPPFNPPGLYSQAFLPMDSSNVMEMSELKQLDIDTANSAVAIADYFPAKNVLLAVYMEDGLLRAWEIDDTRLLFEQDLGIVSNVGLGFDEKGDLVVGAMLHETKENDFGELVEYIGGIAIWDIDTGKLVYCVVHPCDKSNSDWQRDAITGVTLDPNGRWVIENREIWISMSDITNVDVSHSFSEGGDENPRYAGLIAIDSRKNRYAIAFREGEVIIGGIGKTGIGWVFSRIFLGKYERGIRHEIAGLSFSPDGKWLVRIQDDLLAIWKIEVRRGKLLFEHNIPDGRLLAFDRSSELLFIGTNDEIRIFNLKRMEFIGEYATPGITSLAVSADNRLLIWGDQSGIIHIWGIQ